MKTTHHVETTPLVVDGIMYATRPPDDVVALDTQTGRTLWHYHYPVPDKVYTCCGQVNRGLAIRSEEHTSELQSHLNLVCRLLLEKKKTKHIGLARIRQA